MCCNRNCTCFSHNVYVFGYPFSLSLSDVVAMLGFMNFPTSVSQTDGCCCLFLAVFPPTLLSPLPNRNCRKPKDNQQCLPRSASTQLLLGSVLVHLNYILYHLAHFGFHRGGILAIFWQHGASIDLLALFSCGGSVESWWLRLIIVACLFASLLFSYCIF